MLAECSKRTPASLALDFEVMPTPEIRKGDFVYRDTFFVDVGDGKRHSRAAPSELKDLLLPKRGSVPAKDQVAHWYEAQLIHYGLTRSKDKNTAKVRLTAALTTDGLNVPSEVQAKEAEMKKEYAAATRKAKAAEKKATSLAVDSPKGRKRKADDEGSTTISLKVDGVADNRPEDRKCQGECNEEGQDSAERESESDA